MFTKDQSVFWEEWFHPLCFEKLWKTAFLVNYLIDVIGFLDLNHAFEKEGECVVLSQKHLKDFFKSVVTVKLSFSNIFVRFSYIGNRKGFQKEDFTLLITYLKELWLSLRILQTGSFFLRLVLHLLLFTTEWHLCCFRSFINKKKKKKENKAHQ